MQSVNPQEKQIKINGLNVSYKQVGSGNVPIVLLHGWGISSDKYLELARWLHSPAGLWSQDARQNDNSLQKGSTVPLRREQWSQRVSKENADFKIIIPDLPGFGKSDEPEGNWNLDDYVEFIDKFINGVTRDKKGFELVKNILKNLDLNRVIYSKPAEEKNTMPVFKTPQPPLSGGLSSHRLILIGHSFGGQIAIKYAIKYPEKIDRLILTGAAGIRHELNTKQKMFFYLAKFGKIIFSLPILNRFKEYAQKFLYKLAREKDYYQASPRMKEIMKNVLAEDLTLILEDIKNPTLLVWGKLDNSTPLSDGRLMNEKIENSELVIVDDANHSLPYQKPEEFMEIILKFINSSDFK